MIEEFENQKFEEDDDCEHVDTTNLSNLISNPKDLLEDLISNPKDLLEGFTQNVGI